MKRILTMALLGASAALAGCGDNAADGGLTAEENRELNEAAEMLDTSPDSLVAPDDMELGNGDEPVEIEGPGAIEPGDSILNNGAVPPAQ